MERADLLEANGADLQAPGRSDLNANAADNVRILVVGNPANTNALIAMNHAPDVPNERFTAMTRLDENRAISMLSQKLSTSASRIFEDLVVWGNHSPTMFPDLFNAKVNGERAVDQVDMDWYENEYMPRVGKRGAEIIEARGSSSAASAANAAIDHVHDWFAGSRWPPLDGSPLRWPIRRRRRFDVVIPGALLRRQLRNRRGTWKSADFAQSKIDITVNELKEERDAVKDLGLIG